MIIKIFDTSALLNGALEDTSIIDLNATIEPDSTVYIPIRVIQELENIKSSNSKDEKTKAQCRHVLRSLQKIVNFPVIVPIIEERQIQKMFKKYSHILMPITDHYIIAEALALANFYSSRVEVITSDVSMGNIIWQTELLSEINAIFYEPVVSSKELWAGYKDYIPSEEQMISLYSNPTENVLGAKINEFCKIFDGDELKDILVWDGERYDKLNYHSFKTVLGEKLNPRNLEQKMAFDLLQNDNIPVKLLTGVYGSGKI